MSLMRNITFQGLCKLIYAKRICNPYLLKWFFVLWFNPDLGKFVCFSMEKYLYMLCNYLTTLISDWI